ncbi:hypothetical protein [Fibrella forsythiae]|nr:hypothetical protein [Fibrella forsythiae]
MIFDMNLVIRYVRTQTLLPIRVVIPIVVVGELEALSLKNGWGY